MCEPEEVEVNALVERTLEMVRDMSQASVLNDYPLLASFALLESSLERYAAGCYALGIPVHRAQGDFVALVGECLDSIGASYEQLDKDVPVPT